MKMEMMIWNGQAVSILKVKRMMKVCRFLGNLTEL